MLKIGLSSCSKPMIEDTFRSYAANGITEMELSYKNDYYDSLDFREVRRMADENGVNLHSLHLPFDRELDISSPEFGDSTVNVHKGLIKRATEIGIKLFVLHPSAEPIDNSERADFMARSKEKLKLLADYADSYGAVIAVENLPRTCLGRNVDEMLELISADEKLRVCFDTNHLLSGDPIEFIKILSDKIVTTHVSDYDFVNERHWLPGEGKLDWHDVYNALLSSGYNGTWLYEISLQGSGSIIRDRDLIYSDFKRNADEIFSGKRLTVIGKPPKDIGFWPI